MFPKESNDLKALNHDLSPLWPEACCGGAGAVNCILSSKTLMTAYNPSIGQKAKFPPRTDLFLSRRERFSC